MKAAVLYNDREIRLGQVPDPQIGADDVLIAPSYAGICGTDLHIFRGEFHNRVKYPAVLGHEFGGRIAAVGPAVTGWKEGDLVVSETAAVIDVNSPLSRAGLYNLEPTRKGFGSRVIEGGLAQDLEGEVRLDYDPAGLVCQITMPVPRPVGR